MGNQSQKQSMVRKWWYIGAIVALFTASWLYRHYLVEARATELGVREESQGEVELTGSAVRLTLTGSRGIAVCGLWVIANQMQVKNKWNELELVCQSLTKLQPHFAIPWLFQSWNLAYNVSVEADRVRDKYYYMARGIQMLAEGTRRIRNNPDLRFGVGFYYQNKIGHHDEAEKLLALFQLSCIDPAERNPERFRKPGGKDIDLNEFKDFCKAHPRLVRRLRELVVDADNFPKKHERPEDIVRFLADNVDIPSLFVEDRSAVAAGQSQSSRKRDERDRFPVLPPPVQTRVALAQHAFEDPDGLDYNSTLTDDCDAFMASRTWYCYSQEPLPDPDEMPGSSKEIKSENRLTLRKPKNMATVIFRNHPARAQSYVAERYEMEGWLDRFHGWNLNAAFGERRLHASPEEAEVGRKDWVKTGYEKAYRMWDDHGRRNHLLISPEEERAKQDSSERYRRTIEQDPTIVARRRESLPPEVVAGADAQRFLEQYRYYRTLTNIAHFFVRANIGREDQAIDARRLFHEADEPANRPKRDLRLKKYEQGLAIWKELFTKDTALRSDEFSQEEAYEWQIRYLALFQDLPDKGQVLKKALAVEDLAGLIAAQPDAVAQRLLTLGELESLQLVPAPFIGGQFDLMDDKGQPYIPYTVVETVADRFPGIAKMAGRPQTRQAMSSEEMNRMMPPERRLPQSGERPQER